MTHREALELAVKYLRGTETWHVWVNYPEKPAKCLGEILEEALAGPKVMTIETDDRGGARFVPIKGER